ncbi:MAG TPA: ATPase, partial [Arenibacter sp.]|nr:ATPase [Arenibacter sp.]
TKGKVKTHATTNLNAEELEELYGNRVRSRMRDIFNLIAFDKNTNDKRK